jgi:TPP-dependent pyruvate/acetoin dehydrogenase alpha subunit
MKRTGSLSKVSALMGQSAAEQVFSQKDPLKKIRRKLKTDKTRLQQIEHNVNEEIRRVVEEALKP